MSRSVKKGYFVHDKLLKKVQTAAKTKDNKPIKTWSRASMIIPDMIGMTFQVHNGKKFVSVFITENMVGHRLGEFAMTRYFKSHSGKLVKKVAAGGK